MALSDVARRILANFMMTRPEAEEICNAIDAATPGGSSVTASAAQINAVANPTGRIVNTGVSSTTFSVTAALHGGRIVNVNSTVPIAITLPAASGSGNIYRVEIGAAATATGHTIKVANATDAMAGFCSMPNQAADAIPGFKCTATDDTITLNGSTKGGLPGDTIEIIDYAAGVFHVHAFLAVTGTGVTPFSATV